MFGAHGMNIRRSGFLGMLIACGLGCIIPSSAYAGCSPEDQQSLLSCSYNSVAACRNTYPTCPEPRVAFTTEDELIRIGAICCAITGADENARQTACFKTEEAKLTAMLTRAVPPFKRVIRYARAGVKDLRREGCDTGSVQ